jgi:lysophospholipase L1-like esterase
VTVALGDTNGESTTTIKSELRRLMLEKVHTAKGEIATRSFNCNVRTPRISATNSVHLKKREIETEMGNWDEKLTLEFNDARPCLRSLEIAPASVPTVFVLGDSTVCDQPAEPWNSWGQMLPRFLKPDVCVANNAESGESIKSSLGAHRFDKVFATMKTNDWLLLQFGHNDMKDRATNALATYKANLKKIVARTRSLGGTPVLIPSMERKGGAVKPTLKDYPETVREVAREDGVAMIDLNAMSLEFYHALGTNLNAAFQDPTHHNNYGSYELAKCVVMGIKSAKLPLAKSIVDDFTGFDPAHPDAVETFLMPASAQTDAAKPEGN